MFTNLVTKTPPVKYLFMFRVMVKVGMVFRIRVWFPKSIQWMRIGETFPTPLILELKFTGIINVSNQNNISQISLANYFQLKFLIKHAVLQNYSMYA